MNSRMMKRGFKRVGIYLAAVVVLLWTLLPILWMFISSITPTADLLTIDGKWFSENVNFNRYIEIFSQSGSSSDAGAQFINSLKNSILVSVLTVILPFCLAGFLLMRLPDFGLSLKTPFSWLPCFSNYCHLLPW